MKDLKEELLESLKRLDFNYYKLILIVNNDSSKLTEFLISFSQENKIKYINLNLELSKKLVEIPIVERWKFINKAIKEIVIDNQFETIILDNIDILFEEHLKIDPILEIKNISKYKKLIVSFNGRVEDKYIIYSIPSEKEYKKYKINEMDFIILNF